MFKRIEFTLNLDDPDEAALYDALRLSLRSRRAGSVIRQALTRFYSDRQTTPNYSKNALASEGTYHEL